MKLLFDHFNYNFEIRNNYIFKEKAQNLRRRSPNQYGYHWIEYCQIVNGLNSISGIPEE
jgi:hypothetical protein